MPLQQALQQIPTLGSSCIQNILNALNANGHTAAAIAALNQGQQSLINFLLNNGYIIKVRVPKLKLTPSGTSTHTVWEYRCK